jgi:hypothetical protein
MKSIHTLFKKEETMLEFINVAINKKKFIDRTDWFKYLTLPLYQLKLLKEKHPEIFEVGLDEKFANFVEAQVSSFLEGKSPPKEIESAVMNCADAYASDEGMTLRAGDYIALQNFYRNQ